MTKGAARGGEFVIRASFVIPHSTFVISFSRPRKVRGPSTPFPPACARRELRSGWRSMGTRVGLPDSTYAVVLKVSAAIWERIGQGRNSVSVAAG